MKTDVEQVELLDHKNINRHTALWIRPVAFLIGYFLANLLLTLHTKWLMARSNFVFPWMISGLHIWISGLGAWLTLRFAYDKYKFVTLNRSLAMKIFWFSIIYSINIAMSNVSMKYVSLSLHQIVRSGTPIVTLLLELIILKKIPRIWIVLSLVPVIGGIVLTVIGEMKGNTNEVISVTVLGLSLTVLGVVLSSLKGVLTNLLLVGKLKLHPLELICLVAPWATIQCVLASFLSSETSLIYSQYHQKPFNFLLLLELFFNGFLAFFLNWISFAVNKETSALTMTVAGNIKQAASIGLAVLIFNTPLSLLNSLGIVITLLGGIFYR